MVLRTVHGALHMLSILTHQPGRVFFSLYFSIPEAHLHKLTRLVTTLILKRNNVKIYKIQER